MKDAAITTIEYANTLYTIIVGVFIAFYSKCNISKMARLTTNNAQKDLGEEPFV